MANSWFRMYGEFATDPKVQMLSESDQRRLTMIFCLRCNGHVTLQDEEVTFLLRISNEDWQVTKALFIAKGFINSSNEIANWDKRQYISDSSAERVARHRASKKEAVKPCNVTVTPPDTEQIQIQIQNKTKNITPLAMLTAMDIPEALAKDWLTVRKEKKSATTQTALNTIKAHAEKNGYTFLQAVEIATSKSWAGFNVSWLEDKQSYAESTKSAALTIFKPQYIAEQTGSFFANHKELTNEAA